MVDRIALQHAFAEYADAMLHRYDVGEVLYRLTDHVVAVLGLDGSGVSIAGQDGALQSVAATGKRVAEAEAAQLAAEEGPCFEAFRTGDVVAVPDLEHEERWPSYRDGADRRGFRAVAAIPMPVAERRIGVLDLYRTAPHDWHDGDDLEVAVLLANMASGYVINTRDLDEQTTLAAQLTDALGSRVVIEQAKGAIAAQHGIDVNEAFERLRKHSRNTRTKMHEVARQVVEDRLPL